MKIKNIAAACALAAASLGAFAEPTKVEAVQYPVWLERGGNTVPLTPGTTILPSDRIRTGANARVELRMGEGSTVKLGQNAKLVIEKIEDRGIFRSALSILDGAFRFTTDALRKAQKRDIAIHVKNVTAGIRGTDLWGKSTGEKDLVCLLEGKISVGAEGHPTVTLDTPLDFYQKPRDGAPAVAKVDAKQVEVWAQETEIQKDGAAARRGGEWRVVAATVASRDEALALNRTLRANGYPSEIRAADGGFAVSVGGLAGEAEAGALMKNLRTVRGVASPAAVRDTR